MNAAPVPASGLNRRRRLLVIYNPIAGLRRYRHLEVILAQLKRYGCIVELRVTGARGHAEKLAQSPLAKKADAVVVAGGDGTIAEAVAGLIGSAIPLGIIPLGTANVLAAEIGLRKSVGDIVNALIYGPTHTIHVGRVDNHYFTMMLGAGFDAHVVANVDLGLKKRFGKLAYVIASLQGLFRYSRFRYRVTADGIFYEAGTVIIAKGKHYGGGFISAPKANLHDPSFQVCLFAHSGPWHAMRYGLALLMGRLHRLKDVIIIEAADVTIE
ncbi:MAG: YegS/Rv2252/BmrU family lipid kinase, partial [Rhodospirillales bacterium]